MNRGDRVFLTDNLGRHEGTITALSHHKGEQLVMRQVGLRHDRTSAS